MSNHVYKTIELVGSSTRSMEDAIQRATKALNLLDDIERDPARRAAAIAAIRP